MFKLSVGKRWKEVQLTDFIGNCKCLSGWSLDITTCYQQHCMVIWIGDCLVSQHSVLVLWLYKLALFQVGHNSWHSVIFFTNYWLCLNYCLTSCGSGYPSRPQFRFLLSCKPHISQGALSFLILTVKNEIQVICTVIKLFVVIFIYQCTYCMTFFGTLTCSVRVCVCVLHWYSTHGRSVLLLQVLILITPGWNLGTSPVVPIF